MSIISPSVTLVTETTTPGWSGVGEGVAVGVGVGEGVEVVGDVTVFPGVRVAVSAREVCSSVGAAVESGVEVVPDAVAERDGVLDV